ncbi:olfactory receptor 299 [Cricetulus griseus]
MLKTELSVTEDEMQHIYDKINTERSSMSESLEARLSEDHDELKHICSQLETQLGSVTQKLDAKINLYFQTMANSTLVTEFLLEFFAEPRELRLLLSVLFLLVYLGCLLGNLTIIIATTVDKTLNTPMYFFLRNLSILDMCYVSVTIPNACVNSFTGHQNISVPGCAAQVFLVFFCACIEILLLTVMAQDRYVAICKPLLYPVIMNHQVCVQMLLASLLSSLVIASVHTIKTFQLSFCHSNIIPQIFCDTPSLLRLSCSDTFNNKLLILLTAIVDHQEPLWVPERLTKRVPASEDCEAQRQVDSPDANDGDADWRDGSGSAVENPVSVP